MSNTNSKETYTLVIGNDFDLEHKLPTQYKDFLKYLDVLQELERRYCHGIEKDNIDLISKFNTIAKEQELNQKLITIIETWINDNVEEAKRTLNIVKSNIWYHYFKIIYETNIIKGENWIDFEREISRVVNKIEDTDEPSSSIELDFNDLNVINDFMTHNGKIDLEQRNICAKKFYEEIVRFTSLLDQYISFVEKIDNVEQSNTIKNIYKKISKIVNFNYTDTFRSVYNKNDTLKIDTDFVHGKATHHNIVLGTEDTLENTDRKNTDLLCIKFKKYFQRIYNRTGLKYKDFYKGSYNNKKNNTAYFFGHSLSINDGDIIKFIVENNEKNVFFYHNEKQHIEQIENLVRILGRDEVIKSANTRFIFSKQS